MLVVTITLVLGVATKLIPQLREFMQNYAGAYVECLLETGELPPPLNLNPNSQCSFENMQASGRFGNGSSGSSGGGAGGGRNSASNRSNNANSNANNQGQRGGRGGGGGSSPRPMVGANTGADASGSGSSSGSKGPSRGDKLASQANAASKAQKNSGSGRGSSFSSLNDTGRGLSGVVKIPNTGAVKETKRSAPTSLKSESRMNGDDLRKSSFTAPVTKEKNDNQAANASIDIGFPFGLYLRYFLIGGLLLALILMVGTQLNSLRKSWGSQ